MKFLALEHDIASPALMEGHLRDEAARVWELTQSGVIREIFFRADRTSAVIVLECATIEEAQAALDSLPLVAHALIRFELIPLRPYPGFARLFR
jgi:hypothetical protein